MGGAARADLVVLAADANIKHAVEGVLSRHAALGIRPVQPTVWPHPERDPGCLLRSHEFLRAHVYRFEHALVIFDREGCGLEGCTDASFLKLKSTLQGWFRRADR
jgi:hypothetical protein